MFVCVCVCVCVCVRLCVPAADNEIRCFSHTHMVGPGVLDFGNIGTMATRSVQSSMFSNYGYRSKFKHANETAMPGTH